MGFRQASYLDPPKPPEREPRNVLLTAKNGLYIHVCGDGSASLIDGIRAVTLAEFTAEESRSIVRTLADMIGGRK